MIKLPDCLLGLRARLKHSLVYDLFWIVADRSIVNAKHAERNFYDELLTPRSKDCLIFDIGANHGHKTGIFLSLGARVVAVDPDPANHLILERNFRHLRIRPRKVILEKKAVSDHRGSSSFWIDTPSGGKNTLSRKWVELLREDGHRFLERLTFNECIVVETTTLQDLILSYGVPHFVKIDVEGHELAVLRGLRQPVNCLSFEVNLPEFLPEAAGCIDTLASLSSAGSFNYVTDCTQGFVLADWEDAATFRERIKTIPDASIEAFWRSGVSASSS